MAYLGEGLRSPTAYSEDPPPCRKLLQVAAMVDMLQLTLCSGV